MIDFVLIVLSLVVLTISSYTDFRKREVPDWISYGFVFAALGARLLYSIYSKQINFVIFGLVGFAAMFLLANLLYYTKQWGGGDAKILMGMGAVFGLNIFNSSSFLVYGIFFALLIFVGAIYGIVFSIYLALKNKNKFKKAFKLHLNGFKILVWFSTLFFISGLLSLLKLSELTFLLFVVSAIFFVGIFSFILVKSVEDGCLFQKVKASQLTEGDWVAETIKIGNKTIIKEDNLGITMSQINKLKHYKRLILVKNGIPFIPAFLLAYVVLLMI
ncbi:MAG: A24 family peptidase [Nanoarchaeota archaeon]